MNTLSHLPSELKETVSIQRPDAYDRNVFREIATGVVCYIRPERNLVVTVDGVPMSVFGYRCHLDVPNADISEGDLVKRSDGSQLVVYRVLAHRGVLMKLILREEGIL